MTSDSLSDQERAAVKERAAELKKAARRKSDKDKNEADEQDVLAAIADMAEPDRTMAERIHAIVTAEASDLTPRLWYGMPAYAKNGKVLCFFTSGHKDRTRYSTLGFNEVATLDDGSMWPTAYALTAMTRAHEKTITALIRKAAAG